MDAVAAAYAQRVLVLEGAAFQCLEKRVDVVEQQARRAVELNRETGVEHVGRGHALMDEPRLVADMLGEIGQEGDDVVLGLALDFLDARDVDVVDRRLAASPDGLRGLGRHDAEFGERVHGMRLDLEPDAVSRLVAPDIAHPGTAVAWDHSVLPHEAAQHITISRANPSDRGKIRRTARFSPLLDAGNRDVAGRGRDAREPRPNR